MKDGVCSSEQQTIILPALHLLQRRIAVLSLVVLLESTLTDCTSCRAA